jgi:hypothetical protein
VLHETEGTTGHRVYQGAFEENVKSGWGTSYHFLLRQMYTGMWQADLRHGHGEEVTTPRTNETGIADDLRNVIKQHASDGDIVTSKNNELNGYFRTDTKNDVVFKGSFRQGLYDGWGIHSSHKRVYYGQWKEGKEHGVVRLLSCALCHDRM